MKKKLLFLCLCLSSILKLQAQGFDVSDINHNIIAVFSDSSNFYVPDEDNHFGYHCEQVKGYFTIKTRNR